MTKPTPERTLGARTERRALRGILRKRRDQYEADKLLNEAYVLTEILALVDKHVRATGKRKGGTGRK